MHDPPRVDSHSSSSSSIAPRIFLLLWLLAFIPRFLLALVFLRNPIALDDMFQYDMLARSIVEGRGYRWYTRADVAQLEGYLSQFVDLEKITVPEDGLLTTFRGPGYPLFLSGLYRFVSYEDRFALTRLAQAALTALLAPLVAALALRMKMSRRTATLAGVGMGLYPILLFYPVGLASENTFILLLVLTFIALIGAQQSKKRSPLIFAGILMGLTMLTRSILAPFMLFGALWYWRFAGHKRRGVITLMIIAFGITLPWALRNTQIMGKPTFVETSMGFNLFVGYHPKGDGSFLSEVAIIPITILDDAERDRFALDSAKQFILDDPLQALWRIVRRSAFFFGVEDREISYFYNNNFLGFIAQPWLTVLYILLITPWILVGIFAPLGLILTSDRKATWLALGLIAAYSVPHLLILADSRFHLTLVPILLPFAAYGWVHRQKSFRLILGGSSSSPKIWLARITLLTIIILWVWGFLMNYSKLLRLLGPEGNTLFLPY